MENCKPIKVAWGNLRHDEELEKLLQPDYSHERGKKIGLEMTRRCFTQMLMMGATEIYMWTTSECDQDTNTYRLEWHFDVDRPDGQECTHYDCIHLLKMSDEEFEKLPHDENFGLVKSWREIMRGRNVET